MRVLTLLLLPLLLLSGPSMAREPLPYGYFGVDLLGSELTRDDGIFQGGFDDRSGGLRVHAGYRHNNWLGFEGAVQSLGSFSNPRVELSYGALSGSLMLYLPIEGRVFEPYARLGAGLMSIEARSAFRYATDTKPVGTLGAGLQVNINDRVAMRLGVDHYSFETRFGGSIREDGSFDHAIQQLDSAHAGVMVKF
ncbi:MAG: outer membrane beta-barrel protein [Oleiphilaceae bacterium]|nr:outer membrane beta-barrel protein [Oleiphilaceae bacterium]